MIDDLTTDEDKLREDIKKEKLENIQLYISKIHANIFILSKICTAEEIAEQFTNIITDFIWGFIKNFVKQPPQSLDININNGDEGNSPMFTIKSEHLGNKNVH